MNTIVVGYDGSESAERALARAAELAVAFSSRVVVTSVARLVVGRGFGPVDPVDPPDDHRAELQDAAAFLEERGIDAEYDLALDRRPADHIVRLAEERGADLIVVGTHEPNLLERLLGLSVSDSVERKAHCDVLVVH
jgi:nucleotide-binding universal stress UspA family protein